MFATMKFTYKKEERLKSKKLIEKLYKDGTAIKAYPLRMVFLESKHTSEKYLIQASVSVPKRNFKKAVDRNRIKRQLRESYRLEKKIIYNNTDKQYIIMISYLGKKELAFEEINKKMIDLLTYFTKKTKNEI